MKKMIDTHNVLMNGRFMFESGWVRNKWVGCEDGREPTYLSCDSQDTRILMLKKI